MDDLVTRLRTNQCGENRGCGVMPRCACCDMDEAADEVERLRAALTWAFDRLSVDGGMTTNEQRRTLQQIGMVLRGLPCAAARHRPASALSGEKS